MSRELNVVLPHKLNIDMAAMPIQISSRGACIPLGSVRRACGFWKKYFFKPEEGNAVRCPAFGGSGD